MQEESHRYTEEVGILVHGGPGLFASRGEWGLCYPEQVKGWATLTEINPSGSPAWVWPGLD